MSVWFQADNDLDGRIIAATKRLDPEIDFRTAPSLGLHLGTGDEQVLALAAADGRVLVIRMTVEQCRITLSVSSLVIPRQV